jgi:hypothetical protein
MKMLGVRKESQNGGFEGYNEKHSWTHKSYLWELPYAKALILSNLRTDGATGGGGGKWEPNKIVCKNGPMSQIQNPRQPLC